MHTSRYLALLILSAPPAAAQGYDFAAFASYSDSRNGHALLVSKNGKVLFEKYSNGWTQTKAHRLASGTKSFTGVLLALAVDDGLFAFDEKIADTITEWKPYTARSQMTYRQLVGLVSGVDGGTVGSVPTYADAVKSKVTALPGTKFQYGPNPFQIFGEALKRRLLTLPAKETVRAYLQRKFETPLGMKVAAWTEKAKDEPNLPSGAYLTAREWWKFGEMVRQGGVFQGRRVVSGKNLQQCFVSTSVNNAYGVGWWLTPATSDLPADARMAKGAGKQRLYAIPSAGLTIVRFGETTGGFSDADFLAALLPSRYVEFGTGCKGSAGTPRLVGDPTRLPAYGKTLAIQVQSAPAGATGLFFLGASRKTYQGNRLPIDLSAIGMTGCPLLVSPDVPIGFAADASGRAPLVARLPRLGSLPGESGYLQALVLDPKANAGGTVSNGLVVQVGLR